MLHLEIITPDSAVYEGDVDSVTLPTIDGEITVLPNHIPVVSGIEPGTVILRAGKTEQAFAVARGVIEVDGKGVRILTDIADRAEALQEAQIEEAKRRAEEIMRDKRADVEGFAEAAAQLERELARLKTVRRYRHRGPLPRVPAENE